MKIRFIYDYSSYDLDREVVIEKICTFLSDKLTLPKELQIKFSNLGHNAYGVLSLDFRFKNRITINGILRANEVPQVIVHELLHIDQVENGLLSVTRLGDYVWKKRTFFVKNMENLTYEQYLQLPWELDVANKQQKMLQLVNNHLLTKT